MAQNLSGTDADLLPSLYLHGTALDGREGGNMMQKEKYDGCDVQKYFERIGYFGRRQADIETLAALQEKHVLSVPYENLEIMERKPLTLDIPCLYKKIVERRRGGYCFELNGLFAWLLEELGFDIVQHFGRWLRGEPLAYPARRHRVLRVRLDGREYLCDVGVGMPAPRRPLLFEFDTVQAQNGEEYRIIRDEINIYVVQYMSRDGGWKNLYSFNDDPCIPIDFFLPHYYCTTHPDSPFLNMTMVYIRTEQGRDVITDVYDPYTAEKIQEFRRYGKDSVEKILIRRKQDFENVLNEYFKINL